MKNTLKLLDVSMIQRALAFFLALAMIGLSGCGAAAGKKKDDFFTSGSREADQRASQKMAQHEQLADSGNNKGEAGQPERKLALYERLGGQSGLVAIVDDFTARAMQDPRVNWQRKGVSSGGLFRREKSAEWQATPENVDRLKKHLVQFFSVATGGPPEYGGKTIKAAHQGMNISNPEFDATIGDLKASLDKLQIGEREQKELLAIVESTRPSIVTER